MRKILAMLTVALGCQVATADQPAHAPAETRLAGPEGSSLVVRMQGPYDADVPLQVVCYFRHTAESDSRMKGAPVELDRRLGGLIGSLRASGEFSGDSLETILIDAPEGTIKAKRLLLIGIGDEASLSLERMEKVGRIALREAARLGAKKVAFAPLIRDQGNTAIATGAVENAVTRGVLLALDTEKRLQRQGFAAPFSLEEWVVEAGPAYYDETIAGVKKSIAEAKAAAHPSRPYSTKSK
ncbi:M17 family peptidase N-terminal domain-containing protein [Singulisphaera sp. PoT]|uniref:M17 family peptidase N-terminal domain-containing protein n=1 Tax=Singulisphaera sp. PoT TaxID=3411797 RepID=UPI003BF54E09